jgi:hypothetical protein
MTTNNLPVSVLIESIVTLITEAYAGPPNPKSTWFVDNEPDAGIFGAIKGITASQASHPVVPGAGAGSTIAANIEHLRWSLSNANSALRGGRYNSNWSESWALTSTDEAAWEALIQALRLEFETLRDTISTQEELPGDALNGVLALVPHAAFHLGLIRQMVERIKS